MHLQFDAKYLSRILRSIILHASKDVTRPHLNGIQIELCEGQRVAFVATDGHRLAFWLAAADKRIVVVAAKKHAPFVVPLSTIKELLNAMKARGEGTIVDIKSVGGSVAVTTKGATAPAITLSFKSAGVAFPHWRAIWPKTAVAMKSPNVQRWASLNGYFLADAAESFAIATEDRRMPAMQIIRTGDASKGEDLDPVILRSEKCDELTIVVMPMRSNTGSAAAWSDPPALYTKPELAPAQAAE